MKAHNWILKFKNELEFVINDQEFLDSLIWCFEHNILEYQLNFSYSLNFIRIGNCINHNRGAASKITCDNKIGPKLTRKEHEKCRPTEYTHLVITCLG